MAALQAPQAMIQNSLLAYVRTQEDAADRAGVKFLTATGQSAKGMYDTFKRLADQILYSDPLHRSLHAVASAAGRARARAGGAGARSSPYWDKKDSPALQARHDLMRAKLYGFMDRPRRASRAAIRSATPACRRATRAPSRPIASAIRRARSAQIDALIQAQPQNPYFHELKGQALLEAGKPAEAIAPLRRAVQLAPNPALIQIMLGAGADRYQRQGPCRRSGRRCWRRPCGASRNRRKPMRQLAMAYGRKGDLAHADLASAQAAFMRGDLQTARAACRARQDPLPGRLARLGEGRRHRQLQPPDKPGSELMTRKGPVDNEIRTFAAARRRAWLAAGRRDVRARLAPRGAVILARSARRDREDRARISAAAIRAAAGGDGRAGEAPGAGRGREASRGDQGARRDHLQFAAPGDARQSAGRRHHGRVLRLQLRLLQARHDRHARSDEERSEAQVRAQGISRAGRRLDAGRAGRGRGAHAGQDRRQEVSRIPSEAARRPRPGRQGARARGRQGGRPRHGARSRRTWRATR